MASPFVQELIQFVTSLLTTGSATYGPESVNETFDVAGQKFQATESITVTLKKV